MTGWEWVNQLDARITQGLLTFLAAIGGSGTAIWIALVAYPRQKSIDRQTAVQQELRKAYAEFLAASNASWETIVTHDYKPMEEGSPNFGPRLDRELLRSRLMIQLYAPQDVRDKSDRVVALLVKLRGIRGLSRLPNTHEIAKSLIREENNYQESVADFVLSVRATTSRHLTSPKLIDADNPS